MHTLSIVGAIFLEAKSSSVYEDDPQYAPTFGWVGGSRTGTNLFLSKAEVDPWLQVRIEAMLLTGIVIGTSAHHPHNFQEIEVRAGMETGPLSNEVAGTFTERGAVAGNHYVEFYRPLIVEYVTIQKKAKHVRLHVNGIKTFTSGETLMVIYI